MLQGLQKSWRELKASEPGCRFQERYRRKHDGDESRTRRVLTLGLGAAVFLAGLFFLPAPGPGVVIVALGAAILARESERAARVLDAAEVKGRAVAGWARRRWTRAGVPLRTAVVVVGLALAVGGGWMAWRVLLG